MKRVPHLARIGLSVLLLFCLSPFLWGQVEEKPVLLVVRTATDARLEIDGSKTQQTGDVRRFQSPPLAVDRNYSYTLRATWKQAGKELQAEREITFRGGQTVEVDLRSPDVSKGTAPGSFKVIEPTSVVLEPGETKGITIRIHRGQIQEPVELMFSGLPSSVRFGESTIPAEKEIAEVKVVADKKAPAGQWTVWVWTTAVDQQDVGQIRLTVKKSPSLKLSMPAVVKLERGAKATIVVHAQREGFEGSVKVRLEGLPPGVLIPAVTIPADKKEVQLEASAESATEGTEKQVRVIGTADRVEAESSVRISIRPKPPLAEEYLLKGQFAEGETVLLNRLKSFPQDDQARFGLGALQFIRAVERLGQLLYRYGLRSDRGQRMNVPFLRLPVPLNPKPERLTYPACRQILEDLITDLQKVEATLTPIQDETVKLPLRVGEIRLDFTGAGKPNDLFKTLVNQYMGRPRNIQPEDDLLIVFDRGDVAWLRGYCHLLMALAQIGLAYDWQELFDCTAHVFFAKVETPHKFITTLKEAPGQGFFDLGGVELFDVIAFIHLIRPPIKEPARLKSALSHLEQMLALSKESWKFILAETDDDHEWIPNPKQKGVLGIQVRQEMIDSWLEFVEETEALLAGKRLIPFWRGDEKRGVNLKRVFTEPRALDLVLWIQGTAATPYLEEGPITKQAVWDRLQRVFRGEFIGFAIWFN